MSKFFSGTGILILLLSLMFTSCLNFLDNAEVNTPERESELLHQYVNGLITKGYDVDTTALGVYYVRLIEGSGPFPEAGDTISVKYVGYLMDNSVFDTSFGFSADSAWTYVVEETNNLTAWNEMMALMNKGCKMEFVIPSDLAYGKAGATYIPSYSSLIFVAIMGDVRKKVN